MCATKVKDPVQKQERFGGMMVTQKESIEAGNPYHGDTFHMGVQIGTNVTVMMPNFSREKCDYLIIVNTNTGERISVIFS